MALWSVDRDGFITRAYAIDGGSNGKQQDSQDKNKKNNDDGGRFTNKEDRQAEHIKESEKERGKSSEDAERIAYATVNKQKSEKKKK